MTSTSNATHGVQADHDDGAHVTDDRREADNNTKKTDIPTEEMCRRDFYRNSRGHLLNNARKLAQKARAKRTRLLKQKPKKTRQVPARFRPQSCPTCQQPKVICKLSDCPLASTHSKRRTHPRKNLLSFESCQKSKFVISIEDLAEFGDICRNMTDEEYKSREFKTTGTNDCRFTYGNQQYVVNRGDQEALIYFPCTNCTTNTTDLKETDFAQQKHCRVCNKSRGHCTVSAYLDTIQGTFSSSVISHTINAHRRGVTFSKHNTIEKIRKRLLLPAMKFLHDKSRRRALNEYKTWYLLTFPGHDPAKPVPISISFDARYQKRWGWNSLDGHGIGRLWCPTNNQSVEGLRTCIGAFPRHRDSPGTRKRNIQNGSLYAGSAKAVEPDSAKAAVKFVLDQGFDLVEFRHDNDTTVMKNVREEKAKWMHKNPGQKLKKCHCAPEKIERYREQACGEVLTSIKGKIEDAFKLLAKKEKDYANGKRKTQPKLSVPQNLDKAELERHKRLCDEAIELEMCEICCGVEEQLCLRHGAMHAGRHLAALAKKSPLQNWKDKNNKSKTHFFITTGGQKYISALYRSCAQYADSSMEMVEMVQGMIQHLEDDHDNIFCHQHGTKESHTHKVTSDSERATLTLYIF